MENSDRIRLPRLNIVHVMIISGVFAVVFGALSMRPRDSVAALSGLVALGCLGLIVAMLRPNPLKAILANLPDDPDAGIAVLEVGLARRNSFDVGTTLLAHSRLMELYQARERYEEAIVQGRAILAMSDSRHRLEREVRVRIAICLDSLGRTEQADAERLAAADDLDDDAPDGFAGWRAQGKVLDKLHRHEEAVVAYEQALELNPPENREGRDDVLIHLVLATFNAGRHEQTMKWANRAIQEGVSETWLFLAHRLAGVAAASLARLDEAHHHRQRAYDMAVEEGDAAKISDCLARLADLRHLCGELDRAEALCLEAESLCPEQARMAILIHAEVLHSRGRVDEALARIEQGSQVGVMASSVDERRMQAALNKWKAIYRAELGQLDQACANLSEATAVLRADPKFVPACEAAWAWLLAQRGDREAVIERTELVLRGLDQDSATPSTRSDCLELIGRALLAVGEFERARGCWERFLATAHVPITKPTGRYFLGVCRWHLDDPAGAGEEFRRATALGIDSHHARLAEQRERELSKSAGKGIP